MTDPLAYFRRLCETPSDAVRWACILEATAPKAGNVYPGRGFSDLEYLHFVTAAEIAAKHLGDASRSFAERILDCVQNTKAATGTNVNLGIALLLGPLVAADEAARELNSVGQWPGEVAQQLKLGPNQSRLIFQAIAASSAGGLGTVDEMDVDDQQSHDDIITAMRLAKHRDRIALQYADGFNDLISNILPVVYDSVVETADVLRGISKAHIRLLARSTDTLIARKKGEPVAQEVKNAAALVDANDFDSCLQFDHCLRSGDHSRNPGTTADLIAAALYILLRTTA